MHELNNVTDAAILAIRGYDQLLQQLSQLVDEILSHSSDQLQPQCCSSYTYSCVINNSITSKFVCLFLHAVLFQGPSAGGNSETSSESPPGKSQSKYGVSLGHFPDITVYLQAHTLSYWLSHWTLPDAELTSVAGSKKTEPMNVVPSTSGQPAIDTSRGGQEGDKLSPVSSPKKPAAGETKS